MLTILKLVKLDLGIAHSKRDTYLLTAVKSAMTELEKQGIETDLNSSEYIMLITDYVVWRYRNRATDVGLSSNLQARIRAYIMRRRAKYGKDL